MTVAVVHEHTFAQGADGTLSHGYTRARITALACTSNRIRYFKLLPGGVIGNSPGSGPGIQGSSPCPAALDRARTRCRRPSAADPCGYREPLERPEVARDVLEIAYAIAHVRAIGQQALGV